MEAGLIYFSLGAFCLIFNIVLMLTTVCMELVLKIIIGVAFVIAAYAIGMGICSFLV